MFKGDGFYSCENLKWFTQWWKVDIKVSEEMCKQKHKQIYFYFYSYFYRLIVMDNCLAHWIIQLIDIFHVLIDR